MVLVSDVQMVKQLLTGNASDGRDGNDLKSLQVTVSRALIALWITGAAIVGMDWWIKGWEYFSNPKLQAKIAIVCLLTLNGMVLHKYVLPAMEKAGSLLKLTFSQSTLALFTGAVSGVSWLYAAMLGVGRPLAWKYSLVELTAAYPLFIVGGFFSMALLTARAKSQADESEAFGRTAFVPAR